MVEAVRRSTPELHVLVSNAGIGGGKPEQTTRQESRDGYELRFAVNYLAGFLLTLSLLPLLRRSAPARVVNVASLGQAPIDFDDVMLHRGYSGTRAYGQSKLAQIAAGFELAGRLPPEEVAVNSLHPATFMPTKIVLDQVGYSIDTLERGAGATVRIATSPELEGVTGRFFDREEEARAHEQAYDPEARRRLWRLSRRDAGRERGPEARAASHACSYAAGARRGRRVTTQRAPSTAQPPQATSRSTRAMMAMYVRLFTTSSYGRGPNDSSLGRERFGVVVPGGDSVSSSGMT
jgi:NAD(P)-dependent dehydrogenase (short-subunit alcohol dehydrogenase family)